jgi:hypothetical protein
VRYEQVPDDRLGALGVRSDEGGIHARDQHASVRDARRMAAVAADDAGDTRTERAPELEGAYEVRAHVRLEIAAADREDEEQIGRAEAAHLQPLGVRARPTFVVHACRELRDVVGRGVGFDSAELAKVVHGVRGMAGAAADPEYEQAPAAPAQLAKLVDQALHGRSVDRFEHARRFGEVLLRVGHRLLILWQIAPAVRVPASFWLLLPLLALGELGAHVFFSRRAPRLEDWQAAAPRVLELKRAGEPIVVAPEWAEPIARHAFGDAAFPLDELARPDVAGFRRLLEVSLLGARAPETRAFRLLSEERSGPFVLRVLENPAPVRARYRFLDHVVPGELEVAVVDGDLSAPCPFDEQARVVAGGLHGEVAFPRERFVCPGGDGAFVGITVIDDQDYRPRRCLWAQPPQEGFLRLRFSNVPLGRSLRGFAGLSYFLFRDGVGRPITLRARANGELLGQHEHRDEWGWRGFSLATAAHAGQVRTLEFEIQAERSPARDFCFFAESVE